MERVGFGPRFGAVLIDIVILIVIMAVVGVVFLGGAFSSMAMLTGGGQEMSPEAVAAGAAGVAGAGLVILLLPLAYSSLEIFKAATLGKMILGLRIKDESGSPASMNVLATRWAIKNGSTILSLVAAVVGVSLLSTLSSVWALIVFVGFFLVFGAARQALHDKVAKSAVFRAA